MANKDREPEDKSHNKNANSDPLMELMRLYDFDDFNKDDEAYSTVAETTSSDAPGKAPYAHNADRPVTDSKLENNFAQNWDDEQTGFVNQNNARETENFPQNWQNSDAYFSDYAPQQHSDAEASFLHINSEENASIIVDDNDDHPSQMHLRGQTSHDKTTNFKNTDFSEQTSSYPQDPFEQARPDNYETDALLQNQQPDYFSSAPEHALWRHSVDQEKKLHENNNQSDLANEPFEQTFDQEFGHVLEQDFAQADETKWPQAHDSEEQKQFGQTNKNQNLENFTPGEQEQNAGNFSFKPTTTPWHYGNNTDCYTQTDDQSDQPFEQDFGCLSEPPFNDAGNDADLPDTFFSQHQPFDEDLDDKTDTNQDGTHYPRAAPDQMDSYPQDFLQDPFGQKLSDSQKTPSPQQDRYEQADDLSFTQNQAPWQNETSQDLYDQPSYEEMATDPFEQDEASKLSQDFSQQKQQYPDHQQRSAYVNDTFRNDFARPSPQDPFAQTMVEDDDAAMFRPDGQKQQAESFSFAPQHTPWQEKSTADDYGLSNDQDTGNYSLDQSDNRTAQQNSAQTSKAEETENFATDNNAEYYKAGLAHNNAPDVATYGLNNERVEPTPAFELPPLPFEEDNTRQNTDPLESEFDDVFSIGQVLHPETSSNEQAPSFDNSTTDDAYQTFYQHYHNNGDYKSISLDDDLDRHNGWYGDAAGIMNGAGTVATMSKKKKAALAASIVCAFLVLSAGTYLYINNGNNFSNPSIIYADRTPYKIQPETSTNKDTIHSDSAAYDRLAGHTPKNSQTTLIDNSEHPAEKMASGHSLSNIEEVITEANKQNPNNGEQNLSSTMPKSEQEKQSAMIDNTITSFAQIPKKAVPEPRPQRESNDQDKTKRAAASSFNAFSNIGNEYYVQLSSHPSQAVAESSLRQAKLNYANVIGQAAVGIQPAFIADRGTYYRVRIQTNSRSDAAAMCERLKYQGASCFIGR